MIAIIYIANYDHPTGTRSIFGFNNSLNACFQTMPAVKHGMPLEVSGNGAC